MKPCGAKEFLSAVADVLAGAPIPSAPPNNRDFERNHRRVLTDELSAKADQLLELNSRFVALTELNVQLASERDPSVLLERVCTGARNLLGAKYAVLAIADRKNLNPPSVWTSGIDLHAGPAPTFPIDEGLPREAYSRCQTLRASRSQSASVDLGGLSRFPPALSAIAAPIIASRTRSRVPERRNRKSGPCSLSASMYLTTTRQTCFTNASRAYKIAKVDLGEAEEFSVCVVTIHISDLPPCNHLERSTIARQCAVSTVGSETT